MQVDVDSHDSGEKMSLYERDSIRKTCKLIVDLGINVVLNQGIISPLAEEFFTSNGIIALGNIDLRMLDVLSDAFQCPIVSSIEKSIKSGYAEIVEQVFLSDLPFVKFTGVQWCSIVLRAPNSIMLDECERSLHDAISILYESLRCGHVIGGAGSLYFGNVSNLILEIAHRLRSMKSDLGLIFESFAESLEHIPIVILHNAGHDPSKLLPLLRKAHENGSIWAGINISTGDLTDSLKIDNESITGILEPSSILESVLKASTDACEMILRIDSNLLIEPKKTPEELGLV